MNLADPFKQLMERRLWPIAVLLVAALAAVPMLLKEKSTASTSVAAAPIAAGPTGAGAGATDSAVAPADSARTDDIRSVLGDRKDPFRPAKVERVPKPESAESADSTSLTDAVSDAVGDANAGGTGTTTEPTTTTTDPGTTTTPPVDTVPEEPKQTYELYSLIGRFGPVGGDRSRKSVERLSGLPGGNPAVLYLGLLADHKTAAFMVDAGVEVQGDGECDPAPDNCQTLTLRPGETEFFTRGDETYQLDLEKIITKKTFDEQEAQAARKSVAKGARSAMRKVGRSAPYRYSAKTGTLAKVARKSAAKPFAGGTLDSTG
jgi:hypothetical protein